MLSEEVRFQKGLLGMPVNSVQIKTILEAEFITQRCLFPAYPTLPSNHSFTIDMEQNNKLNQRLDKET